MIDTKIYSLIAKIYNSVSLSKDTNEAFTKCLKLIIESGFAKYGVLWYSNKSDSFIHPNYWVCPVDLTSVQVSKEEGTLAKSLKEKQSLTINEFSGENSSLKDVFNQLSFSALNIVPFSISDNLEGLLTLAKEEGTFTEDEKETLNILVLLVETFVKEKFVTVNWKLKNKIMTVNNVTKSFKNGELNSLVLKGVNLEIFEGEFVCLLGESGCGKTTLLNILGGLDSPSSGEVIFNGQNLSKFNEKQLTEYRCNNIGFIFQSYNLMPNLTAKENLDLIAELVKDPLDSKDTLKLVGLEDRANHYPSQLSGGQQQRISIARALIKNPKIIFADEPTAALDYSTSIEVLTALENVLEKRTTLVMVTHNEEIAKMADRVVRFRDGKVFDIKINNKKAKAVDLVW